MYRRTLREIRVHECVANAYLSVAAHGSGGTLGL